MKNTNIKVNPNTKGLIVKKNPLINARYKLSVYELRIFNFLVSEIGRNDTDIKERKMPLSEIVKECNIDSGNIYRDIQKALVGLQSRVIEIEDNKEWKMFSIFNKASMKKNKKGAYKNEVILQLSDEIKPFLLDLKKSFSVSEYSFSRKLNSNFSVRFYEISLQYLRKNSTCTYELNVSNIKYMLRIEKKFTKFVNFKNKVLDTSKKQINEKTNLNFDFEIIRSETDKRRVEKIRFIVSRKDKEKEVVKVIDKIKEEVDTFDEDEKELFNRVIEYGVGDKKARKLIEEYPLKQITEALEVVKCHLNNPNNKIGNIAGYVVTAIEKSFKVPIEIKQQELKIKIHKMNGELEDLRDRKKSLQIEINKNKSLILKNFLLKENILTVDKYVEEIKNSNTTLYNFALSSDSEIKEFSSKELVENTPKILAHSMSLILKKYADEHNIEVDEDEENTKRMLEIEDLIHKTESEIKLSESLKSNF